MRLIGLATLALALFGCLGSGYQVHPDVGFTTSMLAATEGAIADWRSHGVAIDLAPGPCPSARRQGLVCMHLVQGIPPMAWEPGTLAGYTLLSEMWLAEPELAAMQPANAQRLIAHELGHAMGLLHTGPGTLMYPTSDLGSFVVTAADVAQWQLVHGK